MPESAAILLVPNNVGIDVFDKLINNAGNCINPPPPTTESKKPATNEKTAPVTLVRLILAGGPMTEKQVCCTIFKLAIFSGGLAVITALLMEVRT